MQKGIRQPVQQRSIETKNKIIQAGYELIAKEGFYATNTAQIAKKAGVSTGIVYGYFNDKTDILKEVINLYIKNIYDPVFLLLDNLQGKEDSSVIAQKIVDLAEQLHKQHCDIHRMLSAISLAQKDVNDIFVDLEDQVTLRFAKKLTELGYKNMTNENVHLAMNLIESYAHEAVYDKHEYIDNVELKNQVLKLINALFLS